MAGENAVPDKESIFSMANFILQEVSVPELKKLQLGSSYSIERRVVIPPDHSNYPFSPTIHVFGSRKVEPEEIEAKLPLHRKIGILFQRDLRLLLTQQEDLRRALKKYQPDSIDIQDPESGAILFRAYNFGRNFYAFNPDHGGTNTNWPLRIRELASKIGYK